MQSENLNDLATAQLAAAAQSAHGRSAHGLTGGHDHTLRQILMALTAGSALAEHESPGEATLQVITGTIRLTAGDQTWQGSAGDHLVIPPLRHDVTAIEDAAFLLTVAVGTR